jgi:hypothetical protein
MPLSKSDNPDRNFSAGYGSLESQELLPPYVLDSIFNDPEIRKRVGDLIARAMKSGSQRGYRGWRPIFFRHDDAALVEAPTPVHFQAGYILWLGRLRRSADWANENRRSSRCDGESIGASGSISMRAT